MIDDSNMKDEVKKMKKNIDLDELTYVPFVKMTMVKEKELPYAFEDVSRPEKIAALVQSVLEGADREHILVLSLDAGGKLAAIEVASVGAVDKAIAEPREMFKHAILANAAGIVAVHNHPSGRCVPSDEDVEITKRMKKAGEILGIPLWDHIIVGDGYLSFKEEGMLEN